jgi:hypothetical protein
MHGMKDETKGSRTLAHLRAASGSLRLPSWSGGWIVGVRGVGTPVLLRQYCGYPNPVTSYGRVYGSTAAPLSSAASSSASKASGNASNRAAPSASSLAPSVSEAELSGAARGVDCLPTADEMTRQTSSLGSKLRC